MIFEEFLTKEVKLFPCSPMKISWDTILKTAETVDEYETLLEEIDYIFNSKKLRTLQDFTLVSTFHQLQSCGSVKALLRLRPRNVNRDFYYLTILNANVQKEIKNREGKKKLYLSLQVANEYLSTKEDLDPYIQSAYKLITQRRNK